MANVYTFKRASLFSRHTHVYQGFFTSKSQVSGLQPAFDIHIRSTSFAMSSATASGNAMLTGKLEGCSARRGKIHGPHGSVHIEKAGYYTPELTIHDPTGNPYYWRISGRLSDGPWVLVDMHNNVFAIFAISTFSQRILGQISVAQPISDDFLHIILLTSMLFLRSVAIAKSRRD
ncbi:hypothetical protein DL89DRAFT_268640 [Linderina pennispora]|uniref:Uncharacterized protein n=1 Tax=Linderina pennispora TaxID=61395 RepID=A0A1Y1W4E5_9FUNG|nr:uncharacterized protein DL89DRAFT_268640 [Linderina pennispora]ORX68106.1 hypothetical protein DL89DRAFT_268640 [Linderina pennispora]